MKKRVLVTSVATAGALLVMTGLANAATGSGYGISTSDLAFQPPATLPDTGTATIRLTNQGGTQRPATFRVEVDTVSRLSTVTVAGATCRIVPQAGGTDIASCTAPGSLLPRSGRSRSLAVSVTLTSPPGDCSCVPFTVRLKVSGQATQTATANIAR